VKVFISWSGDLSKRVAEVLKPWIKCVLQATEPFLSSEDIDKGSLWFSEISDQLAETGVGIICLTTENINAPWILFEAGSLAKGLSKSRVCTFLVNLAPADLRPPLAQFNATTPTKDDMFRLVVTINNSLEPKQQLSDDVLRMTFDQFWGNISEKLKAVIKSHVPPKHPRRSQEEMTEEILEVSRSIQRTLQEKSSLTTSSWSPPADPLLTNAIRNYLTHAWVAEKSTGADLYRALLEGFSEIKRTKADETKGLTHETGLIDHYLDKIAALAVRAQNGANVREQVTDVVREASAHFAAVKTSSELGNLKAFAGQLGIRATATHVSQPAYRETLEYTKDLVRKIIEERERASGGGASSSSPN
jgi:hypothetical protein